MLLDFQNSKEEKENDYACDDSNVTTFIEKMIIFIEVLEYNANIKNIESIYQGSLLLLAYSFLGEVEFTEIIKSAPSEKMLFRKIISSGKKFLKKMSNDDEY